MGELNLKGPDTAARLPNVEAEVEAEVKAKVDPEPRGRDARSDVPERLDELAGEVDGLRVRLDDQAAVLRRTHAVVTGLAESLGRVVASQRRRERGLNLNSFVAYMLFTLLLGGGFFMLYSTRAGALVEARNEAVKARDTAREQARTLTDDIAARDAAEAAALEYYGLLREKRHAEAVARYAEIERLQLSPTEAALFGEGVEQAKGELVDAGYLAGLDAYRAGELDRAVSELRTALAYEDAGPRAAQMRYYLGVSLHKQGSYQDAVRQLELAIAGRVEQSGGVDVRFYLAAALERLGELEQARVEYDRFASAHPRTPLAVSARRRAAQLSRKIVRTN